MALTKDPDRLGTGSDDATAIG
jgi:NADH-quinone oxidoreductase subunit B